MNNDNSIFNSFTRGLAQTIPEIDNDESYRFRYSKKRKFNEISCVIDDHSIIYYTDSDTDDDDDDLVGDYITNDFRVWRRNYIRKYKCK